MEKLNIKDHLFNGLAREDIQVLERIIVGKHLKKGFKLTHTDKKPVGVYFLPASQVSISGQHQAQRDPYSIAATGLQELILDQNARLDLVTNRDADALYIDSSDFQEVLHQTEWFPDLLLRLLAGEHGMDFTSTHFLQEEKYMKMEKLVEASRILNSTLNLNQLLSIILDTSLNSVNGDRGTVYLIDEAKNELWSKVLDGSKKVTIRLPLGKGIAGYVAETGETLNIADAHKDSRFNPEIDKKTGYDTKTILCMPLKNKDGKILGVFQLLNKQNGRFTVEDEQFIESLSVSAALAIENARLYELEQKKIALEKEMMAAAIVQRSLFPTESPHLPGYQISANNIPAQDVSGDFYDFNILDDNTLFFTLGDVSGKGMPAAILMANVQSVLRDLPHHNPSPQHCAERVNGMINRSSAADKFITVFMARLDADSNRLTYSNAGHDFPYLYRKSGEVERLESTGIPIGMLPDFPFTEKVVDFNPGDVLLIYSDGIIDAVNSSNKEFSETKMAELASDYVDKDPEEIIDIINKNVLRHIGSAPQFDDITLMVIKRNE